MFKNAINFINNKMWALRAYKSGQLSLDGLFLLGISVIIGAILYVVGRQVLNDNNLQATGLFPTGLFLISVMPVLIALIALFRPSGR
jgi:hypothetical protein